MEHCESQIHQKTFYAALTFSSEGVSIVSPKFFIQELHSAFIPQAFDSKYTLNISL